MFWDSWIWLVFIGIGLIMILVELLMGVDTGFDLVFLGSAFMLGGLATWVFYNWVLTLIVTLIICLAYVAVGRKYVSRWRSPSASKTNVDTIIGKKGLVLRDITPPENGLVRVGNEEWRARAEEKIEKEAEVVVTSVKGVTLTVTKIKGGA